LVCFSSRGRHTMSYGDWSSDVCSSDLAPPVGEASRLDLRAHEAVKRLLGELGRWQRLAGPLSREDLVAALDRETLRPMRGDEPEIGRASCRGRGWAAPVARGR